MPPAVRGAVPLAAFAVLLFGRATAAFCSEVWEAALVFAALLARVELRLVVAMRECSHGTASRASDGERARGAVVGPRVVVSPDVRTSLVATRR